MHPPDNDRPWYPTFASVCHHAIGWTTIAIGPSPRSDPATPLCGSCKNLNDLIADTTRHNLEYMAATTRIRAKILIAKDRVDFSTAREERRHHHRVYCRKRREYDEAVRYHQEHSDPALPVVNMHGTALIPSLASRYEPTCEPRKRRTPTLPTAVNKHEPAAATPSFMNQHHPFRDPETPQAPLPATNPPQPPKKRVTFNEGPRTYIKPTFINGVPSHVLEILDYEPHPSRETAQRKSARHLKRGHPKYRPGRYADQDGWYWQQIVCFEDEVEEEEFGQGNEGKGRAVLLGLGGVGGQGGSRQQQQQASFARFDPVCGEEGLLDDGEELEETDQCEVFEDAQESVLSSNLPGRCTQQGEFVPQIDSIGGDLFDEDDEQLEQMNQSDVFEDAQESLSPSTRPRRSSPRQEGFALIQFDPVCGREGFPFGDNDDEQLGDTYQCNTSEDPQEYLDSSTNAEYFSQLQPDVFGQFDPTGGDEFLFEDDEEEQFVETDQCDTFEAAQESFSSAHSARFPQCLEAFAFAHFDPIGGEESLFDDDDDDDDDEQFVETDQCDTYKAMQEYLDASTHVGRFPRHQPYVFGQFDPIGGEEFLPEDDDDDDDDEQLEETHPSDIHEGVENLASPDHSRHSPRQQTYVFTHFDPFDFDEDEKLENASSCDVSESDQHIMSLSLSAIRDI